MFEFDEVADDLPMPTDQGIFIDVWQGKAIVCQYRDLGNGAWVWQRCANWQDLETTAMAAVTSGRVSDIMGEIYPCPSDVSVRALWETESAEKVS